MTELRCRTLWTGSGEPLEGAAVRISQGKITEIVPCGPSDGFHFQFGMPAFFDGHCHLTWMILKKISLDLSQACSREEFLDLVSMAAKEVPHGSILRGESWDESLWNTPVLPTLAELDRATGGVPVFLCRTCGHKGMVNSAMLNLITVHSSEVDRENGFLLERMVINFTRYFPPEPEQVRNALASVVSDIYSMGITGCCTIEKPEHIDLIMEASPDLDISFVVQTRPPWLSGSYRGSSMIKLFLDGSFGAGTAALDLKSGEHLLFTDQELFDALAVCFNQGLTPVIHAIGGAALEQIDRVTGRVFEAAGGGFPVRIEHGEDLLRVWPGHFDPEYHSFSMQPNFVERWQRQGGMYDRLLGACHSSFLNPFRSILSAGFSLCFGSDSMPAGPLYGLKGAWRHRNPAESLSVEDALRLYSIEAARMSECMALSSPLEPGRPADMVFLSGNPFKCIDGLQVVSTFRGGREVFGSGG